jgi:hypothetical protein
VPGIDVPEVPMTNTPTGTLVLDDRNRRFLVIHVTLSFAESTPDLPDEASWFAHISDPASPLAGLYAFGSSPAEARRGVAAAAWSAVAAGELLHLDLVPEALAGVRVVATTTDVYDADFLTAAISHDAA